jgi:hypothetical protein
MTLPRMRVQRAATEVQVPAARLDLEPSCVLAYAAGVSPIDR